MDTQKIKDALVLAARTATTPYNRGLMEEALAELPGEENVLVTSDEDEAEAEAEDEAEDG